MERAQSVNAENPRMDVRNGVAVGKIMAIIPQSKTMNEWNIQSRARACQACEKPFEDKEPCHTLLFDGKQELSRIDVCDGCWTSQYQEGAKDRKGFISSWHGTFHAPPAAPPDPIQKENAESLLRALIELNDPKHGAACFILAVMLERKRLLKVKEQLQRDGQRVFIYEHPRSGDMFTITDPNLQLDQLDQVQRDVARLLEHGLNAPPGEAETAAAVEGPAENVTIPDEIQERSEPVGAVPEEIAVSERS
jgi:hypothetical protein